jgi:hypothetical protein
MCFKIFHFHSGFTYLTDWQNNAKIMTRTTPEILSFITYNYITSTPLALRAWKYRSKTVTDRARKRWARVLLSVRKHTRYTPREVYTSGGPRPSQHLP